MFGSSPWVRPPSLFLALLHFLFFYKTNYLLYFFLKVVWLHRVSEVSSHGSGEGAARRNLSADRPEVDSGRGPRLPQVCLLASSLDPGSGGASQV